jgi:hypothetical protein
MMHPRSLFIWKNISILSYLQFPWRFLIVATFVFSAASGSIALLLKNDKKSKFLISFLSLFIILFYASYFKPLRWIKISDEDKFSGESWRLQQTISIFDYLPIYADAPPAERAPEKPVAIKGEINVIDKDRGSNWQRWEIEVVDDRAVVEFPLFYFPGWEVRSDGEIRQIDHDNDLGLIVSSFSKGKHSVDLKLKDTPIRSVGNIISLIGLIAIPVYLRKQKHEK